VGKFDVPVLWQERSHHKSLQTNLRGNKSDDNDRTSQSSRSSTSSSSKQSKSNKKKNNDIRNEVKKQVAQYKGTKERILELEGSNISGSEDEDALSFFIMDGKVSPYFYGEGKLQNERGV
jgi:hypothetical protein